MTRLRQCRSSPSKFLRNSKQTSRSRIRFRRFGRSTGSLKLCGNRTSRRSQSETSALTESGRGVGSRKEGRMALGLFCTLSCSQCCVWNTWGPIADFALRAFPTWNESLVALLSDWGCISYLTCCIPCCWFLYKNGLLMSLRMAAILSTLATLVRCVSSKENVFTIMVHTAAILNGLSGVILGPATALVSAVWFPPGKRTTATGISSACNQLGMAISYLIGPAVVENTIAHNTTFLININTNSNKSVAFDTTSVILRAQITSLMRIEFVGQFLILVGVLCFFPREPYCQSVDLSEISERLGLTESIFRLLKNKNMWSLCLAAALSQGVTGPWLAMMTMTFDASITQEEADKLAFWTIIVSSTLSLIASRLADAFQGRLKFALYILLTISSAMFLWILLLDDRILAFHKGELYAAVILGISASWSTPALFLELASEIAFPVSEAIVGGYMIFLSNLVGALFYLSYFLPWMNKHSSTYWTFGNISMATILLIYVKEDYNRTKMK
ncbi:solute carrier family 49 member 4 homolog [Anoplolepis gracilipes]|uniref:solute carrier family 49 member 4 homolog n=1 Tax=Anoplolepis gracilipes TaxID=354296 RepID=UPI003BA17E57